MLGVRPSAVPSLVARHKLAAAGSGKARRYPRAAVGALAAGRGRGMGAKAANQYLAAAKQFSRWLARDRRLADDPLAHLGGARTPGVPGGAAGEPGGVAGGVVAEGGRHDADRPVGGRAPFAVPGPDGRPLAADFHALRHTPGVLAERAGATVREVMALMRHSDPKLTLRTYGRLRPHDLAGVIDRLPLKVNPPQKESRRPWCRSRPSGNCEGLTPTTFAHWRKEIAARRTGSVEPMSVPVHIYPNTDSLEMALPDGRVVRCRRGSTPPTRGPSWPCWRIRRADLTDRGEGVLLHSGDGHAVRVGFDTLAAQVTRFLAKNPLSGHLFAFRSRKGDRIKVLYRDTDGYAFWCKRLE